MLSRIVSETLILGLSVVEITRLPRRFLLFGKLPRCFGTWSLLDFPSRGPWGAESLTFSFFAGMAPGGTSRALFPGRFSPKSFVPPVAISPDASGDWGLRQGPQIVSWTASDPDNNDGVLSAYDIVLIVFNEGTNRPSMATTILVDQVCLNSIEFHSTCFFSISLFLIHLERSMWVRG